MSTVKKEHIFKGKFSYVLKRPNTYGNYTLNFYPVDNNERKAVGAVAKRNKLKEDNGEKSGVEGFYYVFKSNGPHVVVDTNGNAIEGFIGNGSEGTLKIISEEFDSKEHGSVLRCTVDSVVITKLIEYVPPKKEEVSKVEVPA